MFTVITALICLTAIVFGPFYTEGGYSWVQHSVSQLAAQNTANAGVLRSGLVSLGAGTIWGHYANRAKYSVFFLIFDICIIFSAFFSHRPFIAGRAFSEVVDSAHRKFSTLAGLSAVAGSFLLAVNAKATARKLVYGSFAGAYTLLPMGMFFFPGSQGVLQRLIFGEFHSLVAFRSWKFA